MHYETGEAADNAIKSVNGMLLNDKKVYVGHHIPRKACPLPESVFVRTASNIFAHRSASPRSMR